MEKDIKKAIEIEKAYIESGEDVSLINLLAECGYTSLNEYFYDKMKYQIIEANIEITYDTLEPNIQRLYTAYQNEQCGAFSVKEDYNRIWVWAGTDNMYVNMDKVQEYGYPLYNFDYNGGPIITCSDNFNIAIIVPTYIDLQMQYLLNEVIKYLNSKGYTDIVQDNNDLMINGKKILGAIMGINNSVKIFAFELSLVDLSQIVSEISQKRSEKEPGYLSDITREELEEVFNTWLHTI